MKLEEILIAGGHAELRQVAERVFRQTEKLSPTASLCNNYLFDKCRFELALNFTTINNSLDFIYNNYEAKSFSEGIWSIKIPYTLIKHLINAEYSGLFKQVVTPSVFQTKEPTASINPVGEKLSYIERYQNKYPAEVGLLEKYSLPVRIKRLIGESLFKKFVSYFQKETPIRTENDYTFISACRTKNCEGYESALLIDHKSDILYVGILDNNQVFLFSESPDFKSNDRYTMPPRFGDWVSYASKTALERKTQGKENDDENENISYVRSGSLLGANSPEELAKILLQALKNNDKKTWMRCMHPDNGVEEDYLSLLRFDQHRECLSQQGISNWSSLLYGLMTYNLRPMGGSKVDPSKTIPAVFVEFTYQNKEFSSKINLGTFVKYEGKWLVWFSGYTDTCHMTRYPRN